MAAGRRLHDPGQRQRSLAGGRIGGKPIALVADAILDCTQRGEIVLDPFAGSGTTILAAERTGRRGYGIEIDPIYVDTAIERWQRVTGKSALNAQGVTFAQLKATRETTT